MKRGGVGWGGGEAEVRNKRKGVGGLAGRDRDGMYMVADRGVGAGRRAARASLCLLPCLLRLHVRYTVRYFWI